MSTNRTLSLVLAILLVMSVIVSGVAVAFSAAPPKGPTASVTTGAVLSSADALNSSTTSAAAAASPSVVKVESAQGLGSGVIIDARGYIVTNYHVLSSGTSAVSKDATYTVTLANGQSLQAHVTGTDAPDDLALLKVSATNLRAMPLRDSAALRTGELVLAVGNPLGYAQSVTLGIVSTPRRTVAENGPATFIPDMIQTSAPINPGNSGGALVDLAGRLVGIPTLAATDPRLGTAAQGIGFAIPSNRVALIAQQIIKNGKVLHSGRAYLGLTDMVAVTPDLAGRYALPVDHGVLLTGLVAGGPAARAGLQRGEVLTQLAGKAIADTTAFGEVLASLKPGQRVSVTVYGSSGSHVVQVTLGELPVD